ncbi:hypothetical protein Vretimale_17345 [Volvox reticuliferus]|uniref:Uncharacterized protein n=1 Tax=Volvox reticuliferus TaxID=1737510 RepID=A0A8J4LXQ3_9CHLO|nr:hypothetical protein Vretimale_17345 [Volvox reticuliferus]
MLERLSASVDGVRHKGAKAASDRLNVFGTRKQVPFHVVISELRAELMNTKQHAPGQPCVLLWIRGDTVHVTEDSVGQTVLSWSDTYFAQVVPLHFSGGTFRSKECKFKVQQKGKTIAKTAILDLAKYCSEIGLARDQSISVPLQPSGTLYFVISTAPALEQLQQNEAPSSQSFLRTLAQASHNPSHGGGGSSMATGLAASVAGVSEGGATSVSAESSKLYPDVGHYASTALKYSGSMAGAAASSVAAVVTPTGFGRGRGATAAPDDTEAAVAIPDDGDRPSVSGRGHQRKPSNGAGPGWVASGLSAAAAAVTSGAKASPAIATPQAPWAEGTEEKGTGTGVFKRKTRGNASSKSVTTAFAAASGAAASAVSSTAATIVSAMNAGGRGAHLHPQLTLRKSDSDNMISGAASARDLRGSWDAQAERSLSLAAAANGNGAGGGPHPRGSGSGFIAVSQRAIRSFTGTPAASPGPSCSPLQLQLPPSTLDGIRNLARRSGAASTCSDTAASVVKAAAAAAEGSGTGGGGGWGSWLRSGLGWGRSNHSATGTSTGALSHNGVGGTGDGAGGDRESTALEADILAATEASELRELALDLLHERNEWRARAIASQDALGRAQTARGSAVREAQRLEVGM